MLKSILGYLLGILHAIMGGERILTSALKQFDVILAKLDLALTVIDSEVSKSFEVSDYLSAKLTAEYDRRETLYNKQTQAERVKANIKSLLGQDAYDDIDHLSF